MRKIVLYAVIIFQIGLIVSLVRGIQLSRRSATRIAQLQDEKKNLEEAKAKLLSEKEYIGSDYYLEKVARDELHLSKPGEKVVIVPEEKILKDDKERVEESKEMPNWQKWWKILSGFE